MPAASVVLIPIASRAFVAFAVGAERLVIILRKAVPASAPAIECPAKAVKLPERTSRLFAVVLKKLPPAVIAAPTSCKLIFALLAVCAITSESRVIFAASSSGLSLIIPIVLSAPTASPTASSMLVMAAVARFATPGRRDMACSLLTPACASVFIAFAL